MVSVKVKLIPQIIYPPEQTMVGIAIYTILGKLLIWRGGGDFLGMGGRTAGADLIPYFSVRCLFRVRRGRGHVIISRRICRFEAYRSYGSLKTGGPTATRLPSCRSTGQV
jgi:hypothetical protein